MCFHTYLDLLLLNLVYFVLESDHVCPGNVLDNNISLAAGTLLEHYVE